MKRVTLSSPTRSRWPSASDTPPPELLRFVLLEDDVIVGYSDLYGSAQDERGLGFVIGGRPRWGLGLGHAIAVLTLEHAFSVLGLRRIWAEAYDSNARR